MHAQGIFFLSFFFGGCGNPMTINIIFQRVWPFLVACIIRLLKVISILGNSLNTEGRAFAISASLSIVDSHRFLTYHYCASLGVFVCFCFLGGLFVWGGVVFVCLLICFFLWFVLRK